MRLLCGTVLLQQWHRAERRINPAFRSGSEVGTYIRSKSWFSYLLESTMVEFFRSGAIVFMGLTVIGAGVFVVFYG